MGREDDMGPLVVAEFKDADVTVRTSAGEEASEFRGSPCDHVDAGCVNGRGEDEGPLGLWRLLGSLGRL